MFFPEIDKKKGISLCIINNQKGERYFDLVKEMFYLQPILEEQYLPVKGNLVVPSPRPKIRDMFYNNINNMSDNDFWKQFPESKFLYKMIYYFRHIFSKIMPNFLKSFIKRITGNNL